MSMPISNGSNVEVVTSVQRRRRWTLEEKIRWARRSQGRAAVNRKRICRIMRGHKLSLPWRDFRRNDTRAHNGHVAFTHDCRDQEAISWVAKIRGIDTILAKDVLVTPSEQRLDRSAPYRSRLCF